MTIKQRITRRARLFMVLAAVSWLLGMITIFLAKKGELTLQLRLFELLAFGGFACAGLGIVFFLKCPRCNTRLYQSGAANPFGIGLANCPSCQVGFDEHV